MDNILLTGATGFIGKHFHAMLHQQGYRVRILVRDPNKVTKLLPNTELVVGDLTRPSEIRNTCSGIDTVFHLGGYAHALMDANEQYGQLGQPSMNSQLESNASPHYQVNYLGTKNILDEAIRANVKRFVYFSSVKAVADSIHCIDETWTQRPQTAYGLAKRASEQLIKEVMSDNQKMHLCILRPALVYGPGWKGNLEKMLETINKGFFIPIPEVGNARSMISVSDICRAAILVANHPNANGKTYFVTDGIDYSTRTLYLLMLQALGKRPPRWSVPLSVFKMLAYTGDTLAKILGRRMPFSTETFSKLFGNASYSSLLIQKEIGFKPNDSFQSLLPEIVDGFFRYQVTSC